MPKEYKIPEQPIDDISVLEPEATYSYADYLRWTFGERVELIKGKVFRMSPAPTRIHQKLGGNLYASTWNFVKGKNCEVYPAPFDVRLPDNNSAPDQQIFTVVQPDICVICDARKLDEKGCVGAPDLIIEILSPATVSRDLKNKYELYEETGVKEYWIVYPSERMIEVYKLNGNGKYDRPVKFLDNDQVKSSVLSSFGVVVNEIFDF